jgi:hypothetical protein
MVIRLREAAADNEITARRGERRYRNDRAELGRVGAASDDEISAMGEKPWRWPAWGWRGYESIVYLSRANDMPGNEASANSRADDRV